MQPSMIDPGAIARLPPQKRAELIYATARSEMSNRLWRAAIGDTGNGDRAASPLAAGGMSMDSLLQLAANGGGAAAGAQAQGTATHGAGGGCHHHCCCCHHEHDGAAQPVALGTARLAEGMTGGVRSVAPGIGGQSVAGVVGAGPLAAARGPLSAAGPLATGALSLGPNARYADAIAAAEAATGIPGPAIAAIVDAEAGKNADGSWNIHSRNPRSSAAGLGQFLSGTWIDLAQQKGTWLNQTAAAQGWLDENGRVLPQARAGLLALRYDPATAIRTVADFARINLDRLEADGIRVRTDSETTAKAAYLSHHLGLGDARRFLGDGLQPGRARTLLAAQIGPTAAEQRIAASGNPTTAHRDWLLGYIDRRIQPDRFAV